MSTARSLELRAAIMSGSLASRRSRGRERPLPSQGEKVLTGDVKYYKHRGVTLYPRWADARLQQVLAAFPAVMVTGGRQDEDSSSGWRQRRLLRHQPRIPLT